MLSNGGKMKTRVLLADDHSLFAQAVAGMLTERYEIVDIVADGRALQAAVREHKPDVAIVDVTMPLMSGLDSVRTLGRDRWRPKVIFLTMHADPEIARECFKCGCSAFVTKDLSCTELMAAIDSVMANEVYVSSNIADSLVKEATLPARVSLEGTDLTGRQREILQLLAEGKTMKEIATDMNLSTRTVEWHKYRMMQILRVRRNADLIRHAIRMKLVI
jgi:DNA-binding NarL/FixJ family response regulator